MLYWENQEGTVALTKSVTPVKLPVTLLFGAIAHAYIARETFRSSTQASK